MIDSALAQLQGSVSNLLTVDHAFNGTDSANAKAVAVITEKVGDIVSYTQTEIAKIGLVAIVLTPDFKVEKPDYDSLTAIVNLQVQIGELVMFNQGTSGTKIPAATLASRVCELLHGKPNGVDPGVDPKLRRMALQRVQFKIGPGAGPQKTVSYFLQFLTKLVIKTL